MERTEKRLREVYIITYYCDYCKNIIHTREETHYVLEFKHLGEEYGTKSHLHKDCFYKYIEENK